MFQIRSRAALAFPLLALMLGMSAGCTGLPFLKGTQAASPAPSAEASAEPGEDAAPIEGQVGNATQAPMTATVHVTGSTFAPNQVTILKGGSVTFINDDAMPHSVVPRSGAQFTASSVFEQGSQVTITFSQTGAQPYVCGLHPSMLGTVTVQDP